MDKLNEKPVHFSDCCLALSRPLLDVLVDRLPKHPALILSIGCGSGLLESLLLRASASNHERPLNLYGVEVETCVDKHLPHDRLLRVQSTDTLHTDAILASCKGSIK